MNPPTNDVLARLREMQADDVPVTGGRTLAYVYDSGLEEADRVGREAVAAYAGSNGLDPTAFPSLLTMENELVGFAADLLDGPTTTVGTVTSGGTESVLLAVQGARDARPDVAAPADGAAGDGARGLPQGGALLRRRAGDGRRRRGVPCPPGGDGGGHRRPDRARGGQRSVVRPRRRRPGHRDRGRGAARGVRCHVDACIGGWVLPYAARLGRPVPPWTFAVDGVTSISVDLHKYAYAPKGTSILLHRTPELRRPQYFASARWPGYTMLNPTMQSTKSGGPLAGAWAVVNTIGDEGYLALTEKVLDGVDRLVEGISRIDGLRVVVRPESTLVAFATDDTCDVFTITDAMTRAGLVRPAAALLRGRRSRRSTSR